jgi:hypothetical protein
MVRPSHAIGNFIQFQCCSFGVVLTKITTQTNLGTHQETGRFGDHGTNRLRARWEKDAAGRAVRSSKREVSMTSIEEIVISVLSLCALGFAYWPKSDLRFYGALSGLVAQPFWIYLVYTKAMWGIAPLTPVYTFVYLAALKAHWGKA